MFLAYKPLLMEQRHGRGRVIGFTVGPNFRAYMDGLNVLFLNALFRGPAHAGPAACAAGRARGAAPRRGRRRAPCPRSRRPARP